MKVNLCELQEIAGATNGWPPRGNAGQRRAGRHIDPSLLFLFGIDRTVQFTKRQLRVADVDATKGYLLQMIFVGI